MKAGNMDKEDLSFICEYCQKIQPCHQTGTKQERHACLTIHHKSFDDLLRSAREGCRLCNLFRPFVEQAQSKKAARFQRAATERSLSTSGHCPPEDPWAALSEITDVYPLTHNLQYNDDGESYSLQALDSDEEAEAYVEKAIQIAEEEETEDILLGLAPKRYNAKVSEVVQWLFQDATKATGPEQLWVTRWVQFTTDIDEPQGDRTSVFQLSAGTVEVEWVLSWCIDNTRQIASNQALAMELPGLYNWAMDYLEIPQEKPRTGLMPKFEFYHKKAVLSRNLSKANVQFVNRISSWDVVQDPCSKRCFTEIKRWAQICRQGHDLCNKLQKHEIPTRLINLGLVKDSTSCRLYMPKREEKGIRYATLSHCWGSASSKAMTLREANLSSMVQGIDESTLPRTFQDAIRVARGLGLNYLWIDALCIIQDSKEDWARESSRMAAYYGSGEIMISAFASAGADQTFLHQRTSDSQSVKLDFDGNEFYARPILEDVMNVIDPNADSGIRPKIVNQPLNKRAWTLQERLLAPRIIHYTCDQIVWHCKSCIASEDNQYNLLKRDSSAKPFTDLINLSQSSQTKPKRSIEDIGWFNLLKSYSARNITYTSDLLPALSGIAQEVTSLSGTKWAAGLLAKDLSLSNDDLFLRQLLWFAGDNRISQKSENGSPSWSWSSIKGEIDFDQEGENGVRLLPLEPVFNPIKPDLWNTTTNAFGQVSRASLDLSAWIHVYSGPKTFVEAQLHRRAWRQERKREYTGWVGSKTNNMTEYSSNNSAVDTSSATGVASDDKVAVTLDIEGSENGDWTNREYYLLYVRSYNLGDDLDEVDEEFGTQQFLLVAKVAGGKDGTFERVGVASAHGGYLLDITQEAGWKRCQISLI